MEARRHASSALPTSNVSRLMAARSIPATGLRVSRHCYHDSLSGTVAFFFTLNLNHRRPNVLDLALAELKDIV